MVRSKGGSNMPGRRMRGQNNAALQRVVFDCVVSKEIVRMARSYQMNSAAAVSGFVVLVNSISGRARTPRRLPGEFHAGSGVVILDHIVTNLNAGSADHKNPLKVGVLHREILNGHILQAGMVETVHKKAVGEAGSINDGRIGAYAKNRNWNANGYIFLVGARCNLDYVTGGGMIDCRLNSRVTTGVVRVNA